MKNKILLKNSIALLLPLAMAMGALLGAAKTTAKEVFGYSTSSLPTTIDLNDTSASNIRNYYSSLSSLSTSERQGTNLLKNLKTILKSGQKYYSYDSGSTIWQIYEITDRDWAKSPASSTTYGSYNSSTNKITGYTYGTSSSNSKNNPYIHALYINRDVTNQTTAWDDHNQDQWGINREHIWPKAEGFETSGDGGARGDPMHLMAGNGYVNNIHSNYYYGYVDTSVSYTNCGSKYSNQNGNLRGTSKTVGGSTNVFEPQDCDKGDIARAIFYMVARYNYLSGSDSDGISSNNPNLTLTQSLSDWASSGYSSTTTNPGKMGIMTDLLAWHHADPVDEFEIHRNNLLYTNFTNNRNPFIDFPEWVDFIWGTASYTGKSYNSYNSTPTGYANPSSDTINGYNAAQSTISVTGVSLNTTSTTVEVGQDTSLIATVSPSNATNQNVTWETSNSSIATVSGGVVHGVSAGSAIITVRTSDQNKTATCSVTVNASSGGGGVVTDVMYAKGFGNYTTNSYSAAGTDYSGKANSSNNTNCTYAMQVFNGSSGAIRGNQSGAGNYSARNTTSYSNYYISSVSLTVSGGTIDGSNSSRSLVYFGTSAYANPNSNAPSGTSTRPSPTSSGQTTLTWSNSDTSKNYFILYNLLTSGTALCANVSTSLVVTWTPKNSPVTTNTLSSISLDTSDVQTSFILNSNFEYGGLSVTSHYDDGTEDIVSDFVVTTPDMTTLGEKTVNVSYTENGVTVYSSYTINVVGESSEILASFIVKNYAEDNSWTNSTQYTSASVNDVITLTANYTGKYNNTGKYYTYGYEWRFYQAESATITISAANNYVIDSVEIYYEIGNTGILRNSSQEDVLSGESQVVNSQSVTYTVANSESATNGQVKITKINFIYHYVSSVPMTAINASVLKTYYVGETISTSDITVKGNNGHFVDGFTFANNGYQFTYQDAVGGSEISYKTFSNCISYESFTTSLTVKVARKNYENPVETIVHTGSEFKSAGITTDEFTSNQTASVDGITFSIDGYIYSNRISLSSSSSVANGKVTNTTPYSSGIRNVVARGVSADIQLSTDKINWVDFDQANCDDVDYFYFKIFYKETSQSGYKNISQIEVSIKADEYAGNVANFVMFEDTNNQCNSKFSAAIVYFTNMPKSGRVTFMTSNDYVISTARERLEAWAAHLGKQITYSNNDYIVTDAQNYLLFDTISSIKENNTIFFVIIGLLTGVTSVGAFILMKRRKQESK